MNKMTGLAPGMLGLLEVIAGTIAVLLFIFACIYAARSLFWRGIKVPGGRGRQQRLGAVDVFNLDQSRQLVLLRRDNVEHLVLIGGPNDVLIESQIVRVEPRNARERDLGDVAPQISNGAPRTAMPNVTLPTAPPPAAVPVPSAPVPVPLATPTPRPAAFSPAVRRDPPAHQADMTAVPHDVAPRANEPTDPATALMAALGNALDLKEDVAPAKTAPVAAAPAAVPTSPASPAVPAPPILRAPLQRPVFERSVPSVTRPSVPRPERNVPSLASMSARQLPQPSAKTEAAPSGTGDAAPQVISPAPLRPSPLNTLLGNLAKAEVIPPAAAPVAMDAPATEPVTESSPQDSLETEMARLLGRPLNGV